MLDLLWNRSTTSAWSGHGWLVSSWPRYYWPGSVTRVFSVPAASVSPHDPLHALLPWGASVAVLGTLGGFDEVLALGGRPHQSVSSPTFRRVEHTAPPRSCPLGSGLFSVAGRGWTGFACSERWHPAATPAERTGADPADRGMVGSWWSGITTPTCGASVRARLGVGRMGDTPPVGALGGGAVL